MEKLKKLIIDGKIKKIKEIRIKSNINE